MTYYDFHLPSLGILFLPLERRYFSSPLVPAVGGDEWLAPVKNAFGRLRESVPFPQNTPVALTSSDQW